MVIHPHPSADQPGPELPSGSDVVDAASTVGVSAGKDPAAAGTADRAGAAALQTLILDSDAVHDFLNRLAHHVVGRLSNSTRPVLCGVTLVRTRTNTTVASSSETAKAMDEVQYAFGDGPCLDAARHQRTNHVPDITDDTARWPEYRKVIAGHGLQSILSVPVRLDPQESSACAINLYAETKHAFSAADIETTQELAREAADTVRIAVRIAHLSDTAANLRAALDSRTTIDLAAGVIMAQNRCSQETAVTILKAASSARNLKLRDLAATVVAAITAEPTATHFDT